MVHPLRSKLKLRLASILIQEMKRTAIMEAVHVETDLLVLLGMSEGKSLLTVTAELLLRNTVT